MLFEPEILTFASGNAVSSPQEMDLRRAEILRILEKNAYGRMPAPEIVQGRIAGINHKCCSGNADCLLLEVSFSFENGDFSFPFRLYLPNRQERSPLIVTINFSPSPFDQYVPLEEIIDNGFALAYIYYEDITADNNDFTDKLAAFFPRTADGQAPGKIGLWAWGVSRALDYICTWKQIDPSNIGIIGHSRLGKTALWCGANDERFRFVCSNDSGCMGAAYARSFHEGAESTASIARVFPYWFCENFQRFAQEPSSMPFDQHMLLSCIAPRYLLVNSAEDDLWADPESEQNACIGASAAWRAFGQPGYLGKTEPYGANDGCLEGNLAYYKRSGIHFLGRKDWLNFMAFIRKNMI